MLKDPLSPPHNVDVHSPAIVGFNNHDEWFFENILEMRTVKHGIEFRKEFHV